MRILPMVAILAFAGLPVRAQDLDATPVRVPLTGLVGG